MTTNFTINRLPVMSLNFVLPFEMLFLKSPDYYFLEALDIPVILGLGLMLLPNWLIEVHFVFFLVMVHIRKVIDA